MSHDLMTPVQRFAAYGRGEAIDRLPCVPIVGNTAARVVGAKVSDFRGNAKLIADAQVAAYQRFGYDVIRIFTDLYTQAEAMGARVHYPDDETAYLAAPAIDSVEQIAALQPANPHRDGNLPAHLEAMSRAVDAVGNEVVVTGALTGPFTTASFLIGTEAVARLMLKNPAAVHRLCEVALQSALDYAKAILDTGCTPSLTDAMCSTTVISPKQFREFGQPYLARLVDFIHSQGRSVTLHICGKTRSIWEQMCETGADCLSIDNAADLGEAKAMVGGRVRLMGNVSPSEIMLQGTPDEVRQAVRECVRKAHDNPKGLIVASGCGRPLARSHPGYRPGGMGAKPEVGHLLHEFVPAEDVYIVATAVKRLFDKHGNRKNKHAARLRFLWNSLGEQRFRELYAQELEAVRRQHPPAFVLAEIVEEVLSPEVAPRHDESEEFLQWKRRYAGGGNTAPRGAVFHADCCLPRQH